jgi:hydrogenase maturation factor
VVEAGESLLVFKSDPITFATQEIGWYALQVNANDIATSGATPRWFLATLLLPEEGSTPELVETIFDQIRGACESLGISLIGGHSEITYGLERPILAGTLVGEVEKGELVTPRGLRPGDRLLITKGVPIEATAILANEQTKRLSAFLSKGELRKAQRFLHEPGISVVREARIALQAGRVSGMHDPTEGGFYSAVWELAEASGCSLVVKPQMVPVPHLSGRICAGLGIDPLGAIASGALLLAAPQGEAAKISAALEREGIRCTEVGWVEEGPAAAWQVVDGNRSLLARPERDEIARLFDRSG